MKTIKSLMLLGVLAVTLSACGTMNKSGEAKLFERLGGKEAITAVVGHLWGLASKDYRINHYFANTSPDAFAGLMTDFLCEGTGGPCKYTGKNMYQAHVGMNITSKDFDILADHIVATLDHFNVPSAEKNEVMNLLGGMKGAVIDH